MVRIATRITHTDPKAEIAAAAVAEAIALAASGKSNWLTVSDAVKLVCHRYRGTHMQEAAELRRMTLVLDAAHVHGEDTDTALGRIGCEDGIDGYIYRTALAALFIAATSTDAAEAIERAVLQGGDTDTVAALAGFATAVRDTTGPDPFKRGWVDFSCTERSIAAHVNGLRGGPIPNEPSLLPLLVRNGVFLLSGFSHIARRAMPPYA
jgi:ADP-ribosyl-[dinitrogen reductase] hydrolase